MRRALGTWSRTVLISAVALAIAMAVGYLLWAWDIALPWKVTLLGGALIGLYLGVRLVRHLIAFGRVMSGFADVSDRDDQGRTPLHHAAVLSQTQGMRLLLTAGANVNNRDDLGATPLQCAVVAQELAAARILLQVRLSMQPVPLDGKTRCGSDDLAIATPYLLVNRANTSATFPVTMRLSINC